MNNLQVIDEREVLGKAFCFYGTKENPLFLAKDVAEWIDYAFKDSRKTARDVSKMLNTVDEDEKLVGRVFLSGQNREAWFLTEDGLYEVLMQSRKPIAKDFKREVKKILKVIRQTGGFVSEGQEEEFVKKYFPSFSEDVKQMMVLDLHSQNKVLKEKIEEQRPKVLFAESVSASETCISIGQMAKILKQNGIDTGQNRLFRWLRDNGYLIKRGRNRNTPTQMSMNRDLMKFDETLVPQPDGSNFIRKTPKVTGKGQLYFVDKFLGKGA